jgi:hypothetical protein
MAKPLRQRYLLRQRLRQRALEETSRLSETRQEIRASATLYPLNTSDFVLMQDVRLPGRSSIPDEIKDISNTTQPTSVVNEQWISLATQP